PAVTGPADALTRPPPAAAPHSAAADPAAADVSVDASVASASASRPWGSVTRRAGGGLPRAPAESVRDRPPRTPARDRLRHERAPPRLPRPGRPDERCRRAGQGRAAPRPRPPRGPADAARPT